jgi:hypothetical protein
VFLSAASHNFRRILASLKVPWCLILTALILAANHSPTLKSAS